MTDLATMLSADRLVDLTQPLGPATTLWPGSTPFVATTVAEYDTGPGYLRELQVPEHAGTHLDAPAHFSPHGAASMRSRSRRSCDRRSSSTSAAWVNGDPAALVDAAMIRELEDRDGVIEAGTAVLVHTGWDAFWDDPARYMGDPGPAFPGPREAMRPSCSSSAASSGSASTPSASTPDPRPTTPCT